MKRRTGLKALVAGAAGAAVPVGAVVPAGIAGAAGAAAAEWVGAGKVRLVYDTSAESPSRYLNDHTVVRASDGTWHLFGITGERPFSGADKEIHFAHATAPALTGPWTTQPYALTVDPNYYGEAHLWAPHVIEDAGTYYMFYAAGSGSAAAINLATSTDLYHWTRLPSGPLFRDGLEARDPCVVRVGDRWVMYYCATSTAQGGNHVVAYRTSTDLVHWSDRSIAYTDAATTADSASVTESPFVVSRNGWWYLCIGPRGGYVGTDVYRSQDPLHFDVDGYAGHVALHCAEVVQDGADWWFSGAGWFQAGLELAPLRWQPTPPVWPSPRNPCLVGNTDGRMEMFALAANGSDLLHRWQTAPSGGWSDWETFGTAAAVPTAGRNADGRIAVFALGPDGNSIMMRVQVAANSGWGDWQTFGGPAGAAPAVGRNADGRLEVFALGPGGAYLSHRWQTAPNGGWSGWENFGGAAGGPPVVATNADGRLEVFALGPGGAYLAHRWQTVPSGGWSDWARLGGPAAQAPTVGNDADGRIEVFALGPCGGGIYQRVQLPGGGWSDWLQAGGQAAAAPEVARNADGRLEIFALGPGGAYLSHRWQTAANGGWSDWQEFGGPAGWTPTTHPQADGRIDVVALSPGGTGIYECTQAVPSGGWGTWHPVSGPVGGIP